MRSKTHHPRIMVNGVEPEDTRQERREKKLQKKRSKILQHGRSIVRVYKDAVLKRAKQSKSKDK
ncbi:MAG: hypothetical protein FJ004_01585 [Chloroflexi bacterium]|nr:hypothetical protein [Chloroflexota bacterium]